MRITILSALGILGLTVPAYAQTLAQVGGVPITLQEVIAANPTAKTNNAVRNKVLIALVNRQAVLNEAHKLKIQDTVAYKNAVNDQKQNIIINMTAKYYELHNPISPVAVKAQYDKIFNKSMPEQYRLREIQVASFDAAKSAIAAIKGGKSFSVEAADVSQDAASAPLGGEIGWQLSTNLDAAVLKVVKTMKTDQVAGPISLPHGFVVIQLLGKRSTPKPPFDKVKGQIANGMLQKAWIDHVIKLRTEQNAHLIVPISGQ